MTPRIAIIGAGPGGLTCASVLQQHAIDVTVLERDPSPEARNQGGTLDMQAATGQRALAAAGLLTRFHALARPEGQAGRMYDRTGAELLRHSPEPGEVDSPEIDRGTLRDLLLGSLAHGTVRWGSAVRAVRPAGGGRHRVRLDTGDTAEFDLVVGADGAWSKVRPLVSAAVPGYTGVSFVELGIDEVDTRHPDLAALVGDGMMMALADNRGLIAQRNAHGHVRVYAAFRAPLDWADGLDQADPAAMRAALLARFADFADPLLALVHAGDGGFVNRPLFALPVPHTWAHVPGVTLLGDAAHLMSPFSGLGANLAMLDGAELARIIATGPGLDAAVRAYEAELFPRGAEAAAGAAHGLDTAIHPDGPGPALRFMAAMGT